MHHLSPEQALKELNTKLTGLSKSEVEDRLIKYGPNILEDEAESKLRIFIRQFVNPFVFILILAGIVAIFVGDLKDALVIYLILIVNGALGFYQELKAISSIKSLKSLTSPKVNVLREGIYSQVESSQLVPGDIVSISEGDIAPADIRLLESFGLMVEESTLTGESVPVSKLAEAILERETPLHERVNCLYKGTTVVRGRALGVVFATGKDTELGKIAQRAKEKSPESPLTKALGVFAKRWIGILLILLAILSIVAVSQGREAKTVLFFAIAQLVSAVPEGLPLVVTIALVVGALRLSREKVLVKYLPSVETLGSATYICSDKTGTITLGILQVGEYYATDLEKLLIACSICNDADENKGDPLEVSLLRWLDTQGFNWKEARKIYQRVWEHPFDANRRLMAVGVKNSDGFEIYIKGAIESVCKKNCPQELLEIHDKMAQGGMRVLAFGYKRLKSMPTSVDEIEAETIGLIGFFDPPKENVKQAVEIAKNAGIKVMMITGDNILTARAIGKMVGIYKDGDTSLRGEELSQYSDEELYEILKKTTIVARATPEDKYRIVKVLQSRGEIVAVTGDGANDSPALKVADLGIAMGSGSPSAKESAKMVLLDNNLYVIVNAIKNGRLIAKNVSNVIRYLLSANSFQILYNSFAIIAGLPLPLYPTQILWINLVTDGVQDKAYPFTKYEGNPMQEKPKSPKKVFTGSSQIIKVIYNGLLMAILHFVLFFYLLKLYPYEVALSISFTSAVVSQWAVGVQEIAEMPFFKNPLRYIKLNPYVYLGILAGFILQAMAITVFSSYFNSVILSLSQLKYTFIVPILTFLGIELRKWIKK